MSKIKYLIGSIFLALAFAAPAYANGVIVQIQQLPGFINYTDFKLSCTSNGSSAQFYSKKDGGSYQAFGSAINLATDPCQVQVTGTQFGSEGKFYFKVIVDGVPSETGTTLDTTGPSNVSDFSKERMNGDTTYKIHWKNPPESDYAKVFIYRGTEPGFEADDGHKVAELGGSPSDTMSWDNNGLDPTKQYYYYIRALDKANNSSGLTGDSSTTTVYATPTPGTGSGTSGTVTSLPKEQGTGGSVLGTEATPSTESTMMEETPKAGVVEQINNYASQTNGPQKWILTHKKISLGILVILGLLGFYYYKSTKRN